MTQRHVFYCFSSKKIDSDNVVTLIIPPSGANFLAKKLLAAYALHLFTQFFHQIVAKHISQRDTIEIRRKSCKNRQKLENWAKLGGG